MAIQNIRNQGGNSAVGDGVADDTPAIQYAVSQCFGGKGEIYIPAGEYRMTGTAFSSLHPITSAFRGASITVRGDGPQATKLILTEPVETPIFDVKGVGSNRANWFVLKDLTLDGQNNEIPAWINFEQASLALIERVQILNTYGTGIKCPDLWDSTFRNVMIDNVGDFRSSTLFPAVHLLSPNGGSSNNIKFEGVQFSNNDRAISVDMAQDVHVIFFLGCSFMGKSSNGYTTVRINGTALPTSPNSGTCSFTACRFLDAGSYHINANYAEGMTIAACSFEGSVLNGIRLANCNRCIISGSNFLNAAGSVANGSDPSVSGGSERNVKQVSCTNILTQNNLGGSGA